MYSEVINELILRWLGFKTHPENMKEWEENWEAKTKNQFFEYIGEIVNYNGFKGEMEEEGHRFVEKIQNFSHWSIETAG